MSVVHFLLYCKAIIIIIIIIIIHTTFQSNCAEGLHFSAFHCIFVVRQGYKGKRGGELRGESQYVMSCVYTCMAVLEYVMMEFLLFMSENKSVHVASRRGGNIIIESVDSISGDERDVPLMQYITNA